jgi:predicted  nucleic acid-binding Zn-ribbon protein
MKFYIICLILVFGPLLGTETDTEFENDLIKLLTKFHEKRNNERNSVNNDLIPVSIKNTYDLRDFLNNIENYRSNLLSEKEGYKGELEGVVKRLSERLGKSTENFQKIKEKLDFVIERTNYLQSQLNINKSDEMTIKSAYEVLRPEYEAINEKLLNNAINRHKVFNTNIGDYEGFAAKLTDVIDHLGKIEKERGDLNSAKTEAEKLEIEYKLHKGIMEDANFDKKFLKAIDHGVESSLDDIKLEEEKIQKNIKSYPDNNRQKNLEIEKNQNNEQYKKSSRRIKELTTEQEEIENHIKDLIKKKNKIRTEINTKNIESNLKISNLKSEIARKEVEIKETKRKMISETLSHKNVNSKSKYRRFSRQS